MRRSIGLLGVVLFLFSIAHVSGCARVLPAPAPLRTTPTHAMASGDRLSRCLVVMLPGFGDTDADFREHGFEAAIDTRNLPVDTVAVSATFGYYARRTLLERMRIDVLEPARAAGYEQIWLLGISMGGMGTLLVASDEHAHQREVAGIVLLAPYLGDAQVQKEVASAGGLARWQPPAPTPDEDYAFGVWRWLKVATDKPESAPAIYLGAGDADDRGLGYRALAAALPPGHLFSAKGPHDWGPWNVMWNAFLDTSDLRARCTLH